MSQTIPTMHETEALICGKYRIECEIGRGGMGIVYRALHVGLDCPVALKIVLPELAQNEMVVRRMLDEARCAAQITSAHVVRVMDVGQLESGQPFIVMELVAGDDLARVVERDGKPSRELAVQWVLETAVAIAEAHEKGIVHRDLKPENIFLARTDGAAPVIKVLDFGISKRLDRSVQRSVTQAHDLMGSPHYMAPEQIRAPLSVDARADIWSLGAILIELLTGRHAFSGETLAAVCANVLESDPDLPEDAVAELPPALLLALRRAVEKDPNDRFQSVAELARALAPFAPPRAEPSLHAIARRSLRGATQRSFPLSDCNVALPSLGLARPQPARRRNAVLGGLGLIAAVGVNFWLATHGSGSAPSPTASMVEGPGGVPSVPVPAARPSAADPLPASTLLPSEPSSAPLPSSELSPPAGAALPLLATPPGAANPSTPPRSLESTAQRGVASAGTSLASSVPPTAARPSASPAANDPPRRPTPPDTAAASGPGAARAPGKNAWDLETFGGRR